jgi:predicted O-methyltransferase YrrM
MKDTLSYIVNKYGIKMEGKPPFIVNNITRTEMAKTFHELNFKVGAEIGVAQGWHAQILCRENPQARLYAIDVWEKYDGFNEYRDRIDKYYHDAKKLLSPFNCRLIKAFSMDALKQFDDNSLDFVFIDGAHDFKNVAMDICEWSKKVRPGGIVYGHDYKRWGEHSHNFRKGYRVDVKDVVQAYMYAKGIKTWFALENTIPDPKFGRDNPCFMFVRKEDDRL